MTNVFTMGQGLQREKSSSLVSERQREALVKGAPESHTERGRGQDDARGPGSEARAEAEAVAPTVGRWGADNFISLYDAFEKSAEPLQQLFGKYNPPIRPRQHTCVGLGFELLRRWRSLDKRRPGFAAACALVSCEEAVEDVREYVTCGKPVMVCVQIVMDGRAGVLLADPGYHVPRVVTVMADRGYPHTGWFTLSEEPLCRKEYSYGFSPLNSGYVEWRERETRGPKFKCQTSLVYVARPYLDGVNVTERRNLVYNFRSLLARDQKGHLIAGLYFPVGGRGKDAQFTLFFDTGAEKHKTKYKFNSFINPDAIPETISEEVEICNSQMNYKKGELRNIICRLAEVLANQSFIEQLLEINDDICRMCL
ncbi:hypothetical protein RR46_04747 [Papilio xuthus]|uniref:Uncharacterized protein n=1 Tax=Papilio xuthus TaxID=66420 RepID=A0A194Q354_PAPXU|nr:hypothetical protein RR46_04747 [Papilio xuthus]